MHTHTQRERERERERERDIHTHTHTQTDTDTHIERERKKESHTHTHTHTHTLYYTPNTSINTLTISLWIRFLYNNDNNTSPVCCQGRLKGDEARLPFHAEQSLTYLFAHSLDLELIQSHILTHKSIKMATFIH